ncbi:ADP-ribosylglycohydrolase family protein [Macrococcoides goetzii]|uniref:ADP-ribosylglycohydrolase family protein n=1 Tax=Macrococcoides goetzii TaxID=1891097 RepID=A0A395G9I7_9STAP|nr:ADP-ribosylglycohydrolase family protein [Macrococcus goetzii]RAI80664.1 ADP-ribosylglycohydrolase family protein [Macrococcus goetzii]
MINQLKGMIYGFIVGDALGVPVEFKPRGTFEVNDMIGYGTYDLPPGTWSDDSSLLLCTIEHMNENSTLDDLMQKFADFDYRNYMTPFGETFDIGITTHEACQNFEYLKRSATDCGLSGEYDNGNGSLMRIAPIVKKTLDLPIEDKYRVVSDYSKLTHGHERSIMGCMIYILVLEALLSNIYKSDLINHVQIQLEELGKDYSDYYRIFNGLKILHIDEIRSTGYVVDTLEAVLYCYLNHETYQEGVFAAINLGGDTDTIGALTGALFGVTSGYIAEIDKYKSRLANLEKIESIVEWYSDKR